MGYYPTGYFSLRIGATEIRHVDVYRGTRHDHTLPVLWPLKRMKRIVRPERLDTLSPQDSRAVRSRGDLHRVNICMRNHALMADALQNVLNPGLAARITELGAGDGRFFLRVAERLRTVGWVSSFAPEHPSQVTDITLLDMQSNVSADTIGALAALGWHGEAIVADVFDWIRTAQPAEVVIANLFLHHFENAQLVELLRLVSLRTKVFIAIEPRRAAWPMFCSRLLWALGCNDVTRHDAVVSVRAGFAGGELSALWPDHDHWQHAEHRSGLFSHVFIARHNTT